MVAQQLKCWTVNHEDRGSSLPTAILKRAQFHLPPYCLCFSDEKLKAAARSLLPGVCQRKQNVLHGVNVLPVVISQILTKQNLQQVECGH